MADAKTRPSNPSKQLPEDSWVLEGDDEGGTSSDLDYDEDALAAATPPAFVDQADSENADELSPLRSAKLSPTKMNKSSPKSPKAGFLSPASRGEKAQRSRLNTAEPEFVMPSPISSHMGSSWANGGSSATLTASRYRKGARASKPRHRESPEPKHRRKGRKDSNKSWDAGAELRQLLFTAYDQFVLPVLQTIISVALTFLAFLKPLLVVLAAAWILLYLISRFGTSAISYALAPICNIPGSSFLNLPFCSIHQVSGPPEFEQLITVQSAFEDVLAASAGGASLPVDMKRSEASIRDLKHVVQYSTLPARNELVFEFEGFISTARQASGDLNRFNSRIGRAVDQVLSTTRWTLQVLDGAAARDEATGAVARFLSHTILLPFRHPRVTEALLLDQYIRHARAIEDQIAELILEAQALLGILQNLDDRLDVIHAITTRAGLAVQGDRDELFAHLWVWLGGSRGEVRRLAEQTQLLRQVATYRKTAWDHVAGTVLKLQAIAAGLEDLRERVAMPEVLGYREDLPLRVHIENIQMGVQRLEQQRMESRRVEGENYRRVVEGAAPLAAGEKRALDAG